MPDSGASKRSVAVRLSHADMALQEQSETVLAPGEAPDLRARIESMLTGVAEALKHMTDAVFPELRMKWIEECATDFVVSDQLTALDEMLTSKIESKASESELATIPRNLLRDDRWVSNMAERLAEMRQRARDAREAEGLDPEEDDDTRNITATISELRRQFRAFGDDHHEIVEGLREVRNEVETSTAERDAESARAFKVCSCEQRFLDNLTSMIR